MKKYTIPFIFAFTLGLTLILLMGTTPSQASPNQPRGLPTQPIGSDIYTSQQTGNGILSTSNQSIFGPLHCTDHGDPFSPLNSIFNDVHPYPYRYRILVPASYEAEAGTNILRVELFDPDAINSSINDATVQRTIAAVNAGGLTPFDNLSCDLGSRAVPQKWPCLIPTGEVDTNSSSPTFGDPVGDLSSDQVNPFWFLRVDENWGLNNGNCSADYNHYRLDTMPQTRFDLYYYMENADGTVTEIPLSSYTGQNGFEALDHQTDLQWVSPGAEVSFGWDKDTPGVDVPTDPGSRTAHGFEIDLSNEVPNMVIDPQTGNRYIYLNVTTLNGSAENGFDIWAGPPNYVNTVPANVNLRNVHLLNNRSSHSSKGVNVFAMGYLPQNSNTNYPIEKPLTYVSPEQTGESIYISLFDSDATVNHPVITFYFDTIAKEDWSLTFGDTSTIFDPDGITTTVRCLPGHCNGKWVDPAYEIKLPNGTKDCDFSNPTSESCTPFYGGRLMARYHGGQQDTYGWQVSAPEGNPNDLNQYEGCDAFPITIHEGVRSVTPTGQGTNPYPNTGDFDAPANPRNYASFIHHVDNTPLAEATEGTVFKVRQGSGSANFGWLVWNEGISANSITLGDSLAWPGNTLDYTNHGDGGQILPGQDHVVRGYVEPTDSSDTELHLEDWIVASTGAINSSSNRAIFNEHIALGRVLRLPIWNNSQDSGGFGSYQTAAFALFRIHGYSLSQGQGGSWILLEFIRFDNSCGQPPTLLNDVTIDALTRTFPHEDVTFTANIMPVTATQPLSYTWEATGFAPITQSNGISDTISFNWATTGNKTITVTAQNVGNSVIDTHTINVTDLLEGKDLTIIGAPQLVTPLPIEEGDPVEFAVTVKNLGDTAVSQQAFIDLFINPNNIDPDGIPPAQSDGFNLLYDLDPGESKTINITIPDGLTKPNTPHQIYAMIDTFKNITEVNETNNISVALSFDASNFAEKKFIYLPMIIKN